MAEEMTVDATAFLGMHHPDSAVRSAWKTFFVDRFAAGLVMSLEEVGRCDDMVWRTPRAVQDDYYPFMDLLHTDAEIRRNGYAEADLTVAVADTHLAGLTVAQRLLVAFARRQGGLLVTADTALLARAGLPVAAVPPGRGDAVFPEPLEALYQRSLALRTLADDRAGAPPVGG